MSILDLVFQNDLEALLSICKCAQYQSDTELHKQLEQRDIYGNTPLLKACYLGKLKFVKKLLGFGANIRAINNLGQNALTLATYAGKVAIIHELLLYRSYEDFNKSSIIPALCVATLQQNKQLIKFFESLDTQHDMDLHTVHGLSAQHISQMLRKLHEIEQEDSQI